MHDSILIVEDDERLACALTTRLQAAGYIVRHADSGGAALSAASSLHPAVIILDIRLPDMDGFRVCQQLRAQPALHDTPIIFLSSNASREDRKRANAAGGTEFFAKPCSPPELLAAIKRLCPRQRPSEVAASSVKSGPT